MNSTSDGHHHACRELAKAMDGSEGLIVGSYIAPCIALNKGGYEAINRDRNTLARRVADLAIRYR